MMKRWLSLLLTIILILGMVPTASAQDERGTLYYKDANRQINDSNQVEYTEASQDPSTALTMSPSDMKYVVFYQEAEDTNYTPFIPASLSSSDTSVVTIESAENSTTTSTNLPVYRILSLAPGSATITATDTSGTALMLTVSVDIPQGGAYYVAQERTPANYRKEFTYDGSALTIWYMSADGFTNENIGNPVVKIDNLEDASITIEKVARAGANDAYDIKITVPAGWSNTAATHRLQLHFSNNAQMNVTLRVTEPIETPPSDLPEVSDYVAMVENYTIGFGNTFAGNLSIHDNGIITRTTEQNPSESNSYRHVIDLGVVAGTQRTDASGGIYYEPAGEAVALTVKRLWIKTISGSDMTFSLSNAGHQIYKTSGLGNATYSFYQKEGYLGEAQFCAEVEVSVNGNAAQTVLISTKARVTQSTSFTENRSVNDTVEALNQALAALATRIEPGSQITKEFRVNLAAVTYEGTIHIPTGFDNLNKLILQGTTAPGTETVVTGGIDLNRAGVDTISSVHFRAAESADAPTKAIYNGSCRTMSQCTFYGYDIALESTKYGMVNPTYGNVFVNNDIAARLDVTDPQGTIMRLDWNNNTFINNRIAVQASSFNSFVSPYNFRITNSNFINNEYDFDLQCAGTVYLYRNYFGEYKSSNGNGPKPGMPSHTNGNGKDDLRLQEVLEAKTLKKLENVLKHRKAQINTIPGSKVIANPRWKYPVKDWWTGNTLIDNAIFGGNGNPSAMLLTEAPDPEYENILTADWEEPTQIVNEESNSLQLDITAFDDEGQKTIDVVDAQENPVGSWEFPA